MTTEAKQSLSFLSLAILTCALLAAGCSNDSGTATPVVHAVGSVTIDTANVVTVPVHWQGPESITELSRIDSSCNGYANSVVVAGHVTHIAGTTFVCSEGGAVRTPVAAYWKNGVRTDLERPQTHARSGSEAQQVVVANGSVYVAGYVTGDNGQLPVYWKDGKLVYLTDIPYEGTRARASNIYVEGSDVFVSGAVLFDSAYPVYWKNGVAMELPVPSGYQGTAVPLPISVSKGDVYVFGHLHRLRTRTIADTAEIPVYWKNGEVVRILPSETDKGYSYGGAVHNGVPYSVGAIVDGTLYTPAVWADKVRRNLPMIDEGLYGMAHDVHIDGAGVYVSGWTYKPENPADPSSMLRAVPCCWVNGERVDLPTINNKPAYARGLFVAR
ncbi:MAG: hypothetical protein EG824_04935 [Deltaproteobacteria bacterium]|nr:hypothetical protein [Deltaproteobacteria bacterium]